MMMCNLGDEFLFCSCLLLISMYFNILVKCRTNQLVLKYKTNIFIPFYSLYYSPDTVVFFLIVIVHCYNE